MLTSFKYFFFFCLAFCSIFLISCGDSRYPGFDETDSGLRYKFHVRGEDTAHPQYGEIVRLKMITRIGDSTLDNTNLIYPAGVRKNLMKPLFKGAVEDGIRMMAVGDSATFLIPTDSINKYYPAKDSAHNFKPNDYLEFSLKLMNIQTMDEVIQEEKDNRNEYINERKEKGPKELDQFIQDNHIAVKPTLSGLYFIEITKGKGASPKDGDTVIVHYTGAFLNGTIFDSSVKRNEPFTFVVNDKGQMSVIEGWNEAVKMMKRGSVATIILPYSLAYDSTGYEDTETGKYFIPPYSPMKFDIQLLDFNSKK